jgi:hypothetical protein
VHYATIHFTCVGGGDLEAGGVEWLDQDLWKQARELCCMEPIIVNYELSSIYWGFGLFPSSGILENTTFRKLDLFPTSGEGGGEGTYSVGPLRKS